MVVVQDVVVLVARVLWQVTLVERSTKLKNVGWFNGIVVETLGAKIVGVVVAEADVVVVN